MLSDALEDGNPDDDDSDHSSSDSEGGESEAEEIDPCVDGATGVAPGPGDDDETTMELNFSPRKLDGALAAEAEAEECSENSESEEEKSWDSAMGDDVPNIPAGSDGRTSHGFNLQAFSVPEMPPDTLDELITPPKRVGAAEPESSVKRRKVDAAAPLPPADKPVSDDVAWWPKNELVDCGNKSLLA